jgi:hypothetical protein
LISCILGPSAVFTEISTSKCSEKLELCEKYWEKGKRESMYLLVLLTVSPRVNQEEDVPLDSSYRTSVWKNKL